MKQRIDPTVLLVSRVARNVAGQHQEEDLRKKSDLLEFVGGSDAGAEGRRRQR